MKKLLSLVLSVVMVFSMVSALGITASADTAEAVVTELTIGENTVYIYAPQSKMVVSSTCTAPCFMVFGDEAYTAETVKEAAVSSGLDALAAAEGATVVYINPKGEAWSGADAAVYMALMDMYSNSSTNTYVNGIAEERNPFTGTVAQKILGDTGRVYIYAEGSGADFAAANLMKNVVATVTFPDGFSMSFERTPTSVTLFNVSAVPATAETADIAVAVVNGPADTAANLATLTDKAVVDTSDITDGMDGEWVMANYTAISGAYRRQAGVMLPMHNYAAEGIVESIESYTLASGKVVNCAIYYADDLAVKDTASPVPMVLLFHGGGNTALFHAQASEWPEIGKLNGFITVAVDLHFPNTTAAETVELLDLLKTEYAVDASRVYATGFSMGSIKSWDLFEQYPTVFAGLAPMDGSEVVGTDSYGTPVVNLNKTVVTPVFYVGGQTSPLPELANQAEKIQDRIAYAFEVNGVKQDYSYNADVNLWWGVNGDITYSVTDKVAFKDSTLNINLFQSADGRYYTAMADASNQSHEVYARNNWAAWDFLSQFSLNADGSIAISEVAYTLAADDGSVKDNSYNTAEVVDPAEPETPAASTYTVVKGDCLWTIASRMLGTGKMWKVIYEANKDIVANPNLIYVGQVLTIPGK